MASSVSAQRAPILSWCLWRCHHCVGGGCWHWRDKLRYHHSPWHSCCPLMPITHEFMCTSTVHKLICMNDSVMCEHVNHVEAPPELSWWPHIVSRCFTSHYDHRDIPSGDMVPGMARRRGHSVSLSWHCVPCHPPPCHPSIDGIV
jgi:hypothetical protein